MSEELGMSMIRDALERARAKGHADDTEEQKLLRSFLDDLHDVYHRHASTAGSELMMRGNMVYIGLALNKSVGPIIGALLAVDLSSVMLDSVLNQKKDHKS